MLQSDIELNLIDFVWLWLTVARGSLYSKLINNHRISIMSSGTWLSVISGELLTLIHFELLRNRCIEIMLSTDLTSLSVNCLFKFVCENMSERFLRYD